MTMATEAAMHKRNLESSILFMQQEHATTLKALHEEIQRLQKRCTDLTFQLTMNGINVDGEGEVDGQLQEVQRQLAAAKTREKQLLEQMRDRESHLHTVEQEARVMKKRHLDEMRNAAQTISGLKAEVEAKSNNIAFLTTEIHRMKMQHRTAMPGPSVAETVGGVGVGSIVRRSQPHHMPAPPRDLITHSGRLRRGAGVHGMSNPSSRRSTAVSTGSNPPNASASSTSLGISQNVEGDLLARSLRITSASARSGGHSSGSESPDISPFVHRPDLDRLEVKKPPPLPPINSSMSHSSTSIPGPSSASTGIPGGIGERNVRIVDGDVRQVLISSKQRSGHHPHHRHHRGRPTTPEVTTLAVDQVNSENKNWNRPPESHSSDYN